MRNSIPDRCRRERGCGRSLLVCSLLVLYCFLSVGQTQEHAAQSQEARITPEEAKELLGSVDSILEFNSRDTGMKSRGKVKRELAGREQVQRYFEERIREDEDAKRLQNESAVLKKFGLIPAGFDLQGFLVELLKEQVAGYYDTKTETVYMLDWLPPETQQPVMAHELTHALQDQNFGLERWTKQADVRNRGAARQIASDEALAARQAVVEGQAMAVMIDFLLAPTGGSLLKSPLIADAIREGMMSGTDAPVMARAPLYVKELLLFPYRYGLDFIRELLIKQGKQSAYSDVYRNPPVSTRQIMQPETYLSGEQLPPLMPPDFDTLLKPEYKRVDLGAIGEFDVSVMAELFGKRDETSAGAEEGSGGKASGGTPPIWTQWRGGYYYASAPVKQRPTASPEEGSDGQIAMVYVSRWASAESAADFAKIYRASMDKRYVTEKPDGPCSNCAPSGKNSVTTLNTNHGLVSLEVEGTTVLAIESFDANAASRIRGAVLGHK